MHGTYYHSYVTWKDEISNIFTTPSKPSLFIERVLQFAHLYYEDFLYENSTSTSVTPFPSNVYLAF